MQKPPVPEVASIPLAFTFLQHSPQLPSSLSPRYGFSFSFMQPLLTFLGSHHSHQDALLFNPLDGSLSLRRITLSRQARDRLASGLSAVPLPRGTSISLPGVNTFGRLGTSAPAESTPSGLSRMMARSSEVVATESTVATWMLRRAKDWKEIRRSLRAPQSRKRSNRIAKPE